MSLAQVELCNDLIQFRVRLFSCSLEYISHGSISTIHNLIWKLDSSEGNLPAEKEIGDNNTRSDSRRDKIAEGMWRDYQKVLVERGLDEIDEEPYQESFDSDEWDGEGVVQTL